MEPLNEEELRRLHTEEAIAARIDAAKETSHLGDFVLGGVDGTVTTFAIVAGCAGASVSSGVALVLGVANVLADGLSMAAGNYLAHRTELQRVDRIRRMEEYHIESIPEGERAEIREIFARKGFEDDLLDQVVKIITQNHQRWVDTMLTEEWGLSIEQRAPLRAGGATFVAFVVAGAVPLLPFVIAPSGVANDRFGSSALLTALTFVGIGWIRGKTTAKRPWFSALETLLLGGMAAAVAYGVGALLSGFAQ